MNPATALLIQSAFHSCFLLRIEIGIHRSGIGKGLAEIALDLVSRRQVQLLKELRRHGDAARGAEATEGLMRQLLVVLTLLDAVGVIRHVLFISKNRNVAE